MLMLQKLWLVTSNAFFNNPYYYISTPSTIAGLYAEHQITATVFGDHTYEYSNHFSGSGHHLLRFYGLAGHVEVYLNGKLLFTSISMFISHKVHVELLGSNHLRLIFLPLNSYLEDKSKHKIPRARWRQQLIDHPGLRSVRQTALGHMPGWCPPVQCVGPYRLIDCIPLNGPVTLTRIYFDTTAAMLLGRYVLSYQFELVGDVNYDTSYRIELERPDINLLVRQQSAVYNQQEIWNGTFAIQQIKSHMLWYPHTHGPPSLHRAHLKRHNYDEIHELRPLGFRSVTLDTSNNEFHISINGDRVFCRGACWTSASITDMSSNRHNYESWLIKAKAAGINMIRISGIMTYEGNEFYDLCDELGIMIWQDFQFSNFDYPTTDDFVELVTQEVTQFLQRTSHNVCITVLCGGNEVYQQAAMNGLVDSKRRHTLFSETIKQLCNEYRADVPYVENSPSGGDLPFQTSAGVCHYYGVSAYLRDFSDIRRSNVKFAAECVALANVPCSQTIDSFSFPAVHHPTWKLGVPRDNNASWDFEDVRDHYLASLYHVDANMLRRMDPIRYLELSRAVSYHIITAVFSEWRSRHSQCGGGLIWQLMDVKPGAGWGLLDVYGRPKAAYHAFAQLNRPVQVVVTDEGLNGLDVSVINETNQIVQFVIKLNCCSNAQVFSEYVEHTLHPQDEYHTNSSQILGRFFDICYSYRFGPPTHTATVVQLLVNNELMSQASHYPQGYVFTQESSTLHAIIKRVDDQWVVKVSTTNFAHLVHFDIPGFHSTVEWVDMIPRQTREFLLIQDDLACVEPQGHVLALNNKYPTAIETHQ